MKEFCSNYLIKELVEKIKRCTAICQEDFDIIPEHLICLENGILNLKSNELRDFNPKYYFKN